MISKDFYIKAVFSISLSLILLSGLLISLGHLGAAQKINTLTFYLLVIGTILYLKTLKH